MLDSPNPYTLGFARQLDAILPGLSKDLGLASTLTPVASDQLLIFILSYSCKGGHGTNIKLGREAAEALPRQWLLERIERCVERTLDIDNDDWEYRRLLELAESLDGEWLKRLVSRGFKSSNPEIVETAEEWSMLPGQ